jgi:HSP20 family protein
MTLVRWNPWREVDTLQRQINRLFNETALPTDWAVNQMSTRVPAAEMTETEDALHLKVELPGVDAKDVDIEVTENTVSIRGERKSETKSEENGMTRTEFYYGSFDRVIPLPARVQNTNVKAEYKDGILSLNLPKKEDEKNKVVKLSLTESAS